MCRHCVPGQHSVSISSKSSSVQQCHQIICCNLINQLSIACWAQPAVCTCYYRQSATLTSPASVGAQNNIPYPELELNVLENQRLYMHWIISSWPSLVLSIAISYSTAVNLFLSIIRYGCNSELTLEHTTASLQLHRFIKIILNWLELLNNCIHYVFHFVCLNPAAGMHYTINQLINKL